MNNLTKYCPVCGTPNDDNANFCSKCGYDFSKMNVQQNSPPYQPGNQYQTQASAGQTPSQGQQYNQQPTYGPTPPPYQPYQQYGPGYGGQQYMGQSFNTAKTMALIAFIFSLIVVIIYIVSIVDDLSAISTINAYVASGSLSPIYANPVLAELYAYTVFYVIFLIFDIIIMLRSYKIYNYIRLSRYTDALNLDSILWIIFGFIFGGIITGVFLLLTKNELDKGLGNKTLF